MSARSRTRQRKGEHLDICRRQDVEFRTKSAWFEHVALVHQAVPSFGTGDVDTSVRCFGRTPCAPFLIGAMTGGTREAGRINRDLARVASAAGVGLALGSQRPMLESPAAATTYQVRDVAPDILLLGNIGLSQAMGLKASEVKGLMRDIGADGMCLHLNTAMEMFQQEGDEPAGRAFATIRRLSKALGTRLVVKETGCGISGETARQLAGAGVRTIDVAGAGGTSWVRVESLRRGGAPNGLADFEEWGIPTAASLLEVKGACRNVIASGGIRTGLDVAKAIALGARLGSAALPVLRAYYDGGVTAARTWIDGVVAGLRAAMVLTGCRDLNALRKAPVALAGPLLEWAEQRRPGRAKRG